MAGPDRPTEGLPHQPALDGVRGLAIVLVLLFHGGISWMTGGYVGVSVFFTLSGFLITRLLLREHERTGGVSLRSFYVRRIRRLMPASLLCLAAVSVAAALGQFDGVTHLRRDVLAALFQVANWNALAAGTSYADLIARAAGSVGPVDHFWSLSIEEQFYWVWPLVVAWGASRLRQPVVRRRALVGLAAAFVAFAPVVAAVWGPNAAYWATPARLGEILVGAALAAVLADRAVASWWAWLGCAGTAVVLAAAVWWPASGGPAYSGWLGAFALASAALIAGLQAPGPLRDAFSFPPLVHLGRISYGVYLYHWPVFALMPAARVGVDGWALFAGRLAVTLAVAELSFHLLEQPLRRGRSASRVPAITATAVAATAALVVVLVPVGAPTFQASADVPRTFAPAPGSDVSAAVAERSTTTAPSTTVAVSVAPTVVPTVQATVLPAGRPARVLLLGDSTGVALADGLYAWAKDQPDRVQVASLARLGCGLITDSKIVGDTDDRYLTLCREAWDTELPALLAQQVPDEVIVMVTLPDVLERVWDPTEGPMHSRDQRYAERLRATYLQRAQSLLDAGVRRVLWVVPPRPSDLWPQASINPVTDEDWAAFTDTVDALAAQHPQIQVVHLDEWMAANEPTDDSWRPDGLHLTPAAARTVTEQFLAPLLLAR